MRARRGLRGTLASLPTSAWLVGGAGVLLAVLALALTAWSKDLVKDTLRFGCTEFGARQQMLTGHLLRDLQREVRLGASPPEVKVAWTYRGGALVERAPAEAPDPPPAFALLLSGRTPQDVAIPGPTPRAGSWSSDPKERAKTGAGSGVLVEWNLPALAETLAARFAQESNERYAVALNTGPKLEDFQPRPQAELALPEPLSTWLVTVSLRDPEAERAALRAQTFALVALAVWLLGVLAFGLWRGVRRERAEHERRLQREQLLVRTTHELQTPLALLRAACESIQNGAVDGADRERALGIVVREEARLTAAIRRLLRHLRLENAPLELAPAGEVVERVADEERPALAAHGIELTLRVEPGARTLAAPEAFVGDLIRELCANARKHARGARRVSLTVGARGGDLRLRYADDGPGFPPDGPGPRGLGVLLLQDGLGRLGGTLMRGSAPEGGALVEVSLPCPRTSTPS
ncbi:MAG: hypothetical protein KDD82_21710 [Planctomycetes bacterium]|nr:hypothetical protein [Planctomycetota bacterium]